ncbi:hypothetical protein PG991_010303 [Apiospora marii]|uniref:C2H2-type domain-containing protein n=1 Tax=Apiospora marii TaxID=335849 RepID=A0ABR1RIF0_9PEZI
MASPPQSLLPDSPPAISSVPVSSPSSPSLSSEHSAPSSDKKPGNNSSKNREKKYKELDHILTTDESMRLPSGKYRCPWIEEGEACSHEEDIPRDLKPVLCPRREDAQAPCMVRVPQQRDMDRHVRSHHTSRKGVDSKYKCRVCKKGFARKDHLKRHVDNDICGK